MSQTDAARLKKGDVVYHKATGKYLIVVSAEPSGRIIYVREPRSTQALSFTYLELTKKRPT